MKKSNLFKKRIYETLAAVTLMGVGAFALATSTTVQPQTVSAATNQNGYPSLNTIAKNGGFVKGSDGWYYKKTEAHVPDGRYSAVTITLKSDDGKIDKVLNRSFYSINFMIPYGVDVPDGYYLKSISDSHFSLDAIDNIVGNPYKPVTNITFSIAKDSSDDDQTGSGSSDTSNGQDTVVQDGSWVYNDDTGETKWVPESELQDQTDSNSNLKNSSLPSYFAGTKLNPKFDFSKLLVALGQARAVDATKHSSFSVKRVHDTIINAERSLFGYATSQKYVDMDTENIYSSLKYLEPATTTDHGVNTPQGTAIPVDKYVTLTSKNYKIWTSFDFNKVKHYSKNYYQKTYLVKVFYDHSNGSLYYSLYKNDGTWFGYINASGTKIAKGAQGTPISAKQYVTLTNKTSTIWSGFDFKTAKHYSKNYYHKTYLVKTIYNHANGSTYYSLYDSKGKWFGYINANGTKKASGQQGIAISYKKTVTIKKSGYTIWGGFFNKKRGTSTKYKNKKLTAKVKYNCANGSTYMSLYSGSKWIGYVNANVAK